MNFISDDFLKYALALMKIEGIGVINARKIYNQYPNLSELFLENKSRNFKCEGISETVFKRIQNFGDFDNIEKEIEFIHKNNIQTIFIENKNYPSDLKQCIDAPFLLFTKGNINFDNSKTISIVGTRSATTYGIGFVKELIQDLKKYNPIIVSGFAYGIDIAAHLAAIENNLQTVAIFGHPLNRIYPNAHKKYNEDVFKNGGFISEFATYDIFKKENFLKRNRIVAGLSKATIVVESALKGGSLTTAKLANDYNRDVFAVPGRISDSLSTGCNHLIKTNQANLLTSVDDLIYYLNWDLKENAKKEIKQFEIPTHLSEEELKVVTFLNVFGAEILDIIALETRIPVYKLSAVLLNLELQNLVNPLPGKRFELKK